MKLRENQLRWKLTLSRGILLYLCYMGVFLTTWIVNGVNYNRIGESLETTRLWYAYPTLLGSLFLAAALSVFGWWRIVLFDKIKVGPRWTWILPVGMFVIIISALAQVNLEKLTSELLFWSFLGALGVGFGEEVITRGSLVVGLRSRVSERKVWLLSTLFFVALHIPNVFFGVSLFAMLMQLALTFIVGSGFYVMRRISGTLVLPIILHGLWDSSIFLVRATGGQPSSSQLLLYPLAIVCVIAVLYGVQTKKS